MELAMQSISNDQTLTSYTLQNLKDFISQLLKIMNRFIFIFMEILIMTTFETIIYFYLSLMRVKVYC